MDPDPNAYRPSSLDLEDAARMKSESELELTQARTMRNNRDLEAVMAIACLVITLSMVESLRSSPSSRSRPRSRSYAPQDASRHAR